MTLLTQADYAAQRGVGKSAVSNWKKRGLVVFADDPGHPGKKLVDVEKTDLLVRGTIDQTRGRPTKGAATPADDGAVNLPGPPTPSSSRMTDLEVARLDEMRERTTRRRLENERLVGNLVPLSEYERRAGEMGRLVRERTQGLIRQHAERLAAETDPRTIMAVLGEAFDGLFDQVADEISAAAAQERAADEALALAELGEAEDLDEEDQAA